MMIDDSRFKKAIERIDEANREDPRLELVDGGPQPREWLFSVRVFEWVTKLANAPSESLLLAARAHTLRRWMIPRDRYPRTNVGYHEWRDALARFHADEAEPILHDVGYDKETIRRVRRLITRADFPQDPEAQALEDADCLVFLETKLSDYLKEWDEEKTVRILRKTLRKMTERASQLASTLKLDSASAALLRRAQQA